MKSVIETGFMPIDSTRLELLTIGLAHNVCRWHDGTLRPMEGHNTVFCQWRFDGQFWVHRKVPKVFIASTPMGSNAFYEEYQKWKN